MSLYDGVGIKIEGKADDSVTSEWKKNTSSLQLLQSQLVAKKASLQQQRTRPVVSRPAPTDGLKAHPQPTTSSSTGVGLIHELTEAITSSNSGQEKFGQDDYDPMRPNDYEEVKKRKQMEAKRAYAQSLVGSTNNDTQRTESSMKSRRSVSPKKDSEPIIRTTPGFAGRYSDSEEEIESDRDRGPDPSKKGAAIAPPSQQLALQEKLVAANPIPIAPAVDRPYAKIFHKSDSSMQMGTSVAAKIMKQYGYKEGTGLGKDGQGIATALAVEKTSKRGGKIINNDSEVREAARREQEEQESITEMMKKPSKVVLLKNMVGAGEVDDDLEPETAEECTKYGEVAKVVIFEVPNFATPEEAVRIFVEFKRMESAIKAVVDLNGRWFGGRQVRGCFYDHDRFQLMELGD